MHRRIAPLVLVACACSAGPTPGPSGAPPFTDTPPSTDEPPTSEAPTPPSDVPAPAKDQAQDHSELAARLVTKHDIALYDPTSSAVVYAETWLQEGTGEGLRIEQRNDESTKTLFEIEPGEMTEQDASSAVANIAKALDGTSWTVLERINWEDAKKPLDLPAVSSSARFLPPTVRIEGQTGIGNLVLEPTSDPHKPAPSALFIAKGAPVVLVTVWFDPGEAYGQGFNAYSEHHIIKLSPSP